MRFRAALSLMLLLTTQAACTTSHAIRLREVQRLETGTVRTLDGKLEDVESEYELEPLPRAGYAFVQPAADERVLKPYLADDPILATAPRLTPLKSPVRLTVDDGLVVLTGKNGQLALWPQWAGGALIRQFSAGKTAGVSLGVGFGALGLVTLVVANVLVLSALSGQFSLWQGL